MACASCNKNRLEGKQMSVTGSSNPYPYNATDISVLHNSQTRKYTPDDWDNSKHKLLIFVPQAFTPVCATELGAINKWYDEFAKLNCELIAVCTDPVTMLKDWQDQEPSLQGNYKFFSSYLLPNRIGVMDNGRTKRASIFCMNDGEVVKMEHFNKVGRSFAELHRMLYGYTMDSYCAEGWTSPEDGFLVKAYYGI